MQFKLKLDDERCASIACNDRGAWELVNDRDIYGVAVFSGFGGENIVTVQTMAMQNGKLSLCVTHAACDSPIVARVETVMTEPLFDVTRPTITLNEMLVDLLGNYPDEL